MNKQFLIGLERYGRFAKRWPLLPFIVDEQLKLTTFFFRPTVYWQMLQLVKEVKSWEGVSSRYHIYGGLEFNIGKKELGHLHGNGLVDVPFTQKLKRFLIEENKAEAHHIKPLGPWISYYLNSKKDWEEARLLLWVSYQKKKEGWTDEQVMESLKKEKALQKEITQKETTQKKITKIIEGRKSHIVV